MCGTDTRATMLDWLVRDGELGKIVTSHFRLDFNRVEYLAVVNPDHTTDHLWDNDHITQMGLDDGRLLIGGCFPFSLAKFLDETHWLALQTALESSPCACMHQIDKILVVHVEELLELNATVRECAEGALFLHLSRHCGVGDDF